MTCIIIPIFYKKNLENKDKNKSNQNKQKMWNTDCNCWNKA